MIHNIYSHLQNHILSDLLLKMNLLIQNVYHIVLAGQGLGFVIFSKVNK